MEKLEKNIQLKNNKKIKLIKLICKTYNIDHENKITPQKKLIFFYKTQSLINLMLKNKIKIIYKKKNKSLFQLKLIREEG